MGYSTSRYWNDISQGYDDVWSKNASFGPTWGFKNDVKSILASPQVVINRVMFNPMDAVEGYVELIYIGSTSIDISRFKINCDEEFVIPTGTILNTTNRFFVLNQSTLPILFVNMTSNGDNVYLYNANDNLMDMVGWSSSHTQGYFMSRNPDGNGTYQGYNDLTSQAAGWVFEQLPNLVITEFFVDSSSGQIELYNPRGGDKDIDPRWTLTVNSGPLIGLWSSDPIPNGVNSVYTITGGSPDDEGDTIRLYYSGSTLIDEVSFGLNGVAPDPINSGSTARYWSDPVLGYNNDWLGNASNGPTWGAQNDVGVIVLSPEVIINRVMFNPLDVVEGYIELMYNGTTTIDISDYKIVCDSEFVVPQGTVLDSMNRYYVLTQSNYPLGFDLDDGIINGDNVYLYDNNDNLLDMVGWSSSHTQGYYMSRVPDGNGTHQGHDDTTSQGAGWVFDKLPKLIITEFFANTTSSQIEIYNPRGGDKTLDPRWSFTVDSGAITGTWSLDPIPGGDYSILTMTGGVPGEKGDTISLYYTGSILIDDVSFGTYGIAPDPLLGESTAQYWDNTIPGYSHDWTRAPIPTFGTQNDVPPTDFDPRVILNKILFNPIIPSDGYIEIYAKWSGIDIGGYKIVGEKEYLIPNNTVLTLHNPFYYFLQPSDPDFFANLSTIGDNVYLYDHNGRLLDMVGWSSPHTQGGTICRVPDGNGTRDGFNDSSSEVAGWIFDCFPTLQLITLDSPIQIGYGDLGEVIYFNLTITNYQDTDDTIIISNTTLNGYPMRVLDEIGIDVISQIFIPSGSTTNIIIKITLSPSSPPYEWDNITISIQSENNTKVKDSIFLVAKIQDSVTPGPDQTVYEGQTVQFNATAYTQISNPLWPVEISGDGYYMALGWETNVSFFSTASNLPFWTYDTGGRVGELKLSENGRYLAVGSYQTLLFFDTQTSTPQWSEHIGDAMMRFDADPGNRLDMTRDGKYIAAVATGNRVLVYDTTNTTPTIPYWDYAFGEYVQSVSFSGNGLYLGMGSHIPGYYRLGWILNKKINWTDQPALVCFSSSLSYNASRISAGGGNHNGNIHLYQRDSDTPLWEYSIKGGFVFEQVISDNGRYFVSTNRDDGDIGAWNGFAFWNTSNANPIWAYTTGTGTTTYADAVDMDRPANYIVGGSRDKNIYLFSQLKDGFPDWSNSDGNPLFVYPTGGKINYNGVSISGDGRYFAAASQDGKVYLFSTAGTPHLVWKWTTGFSIPPSGPLNYYWDFDQYEDSDGDGNFTNDVDATGPSPSHVYGDNGVYNVTLKVTGGGGFSKIGKCVITVNNLPPVIKPIGPYTIDVGTPIVLSGNVSDNGSDDLTFTWDWGDSSLDNITIYYNNGTVADPYPSPDGNFPFLINDTVLHTYTAGGNYTLTLTVEDDDGGVAVYVIDITVIGDALTTPTLYINVSKDGKDVILYWDPPPASDIDHFRIYRSTHQTEFDFNTVWVNTSADNESGEPGPIPRRTMWNDTNAAVPGDSNYEEQYYYIIRAVNSLGQMSGTSRTVGKWTKTFLPGVSTFSIPLEPIETYKTDYYTTRMNADYIKYMDPGIHTWVQHDFLDGETNNVEMMLGEGYEGKFSTLTNYTFTGMPGAMIMYEDSGFIGFEPNTEAISLSASVEINGDVNLTWQEPASMGPGDWYEIYYSNTRDGFFGILGVDYFLAGPIVNFGINSFTHTGIQADLPGTQLYYIVAPFNAGSIKGISTYSIGIWTEEYLSGYDTLGIPLKMSSNHTADWYCDNIQNTVGINYFIYSQQRWGWHSTTMVAGAFDPTLIMSEGYQISTSNATTCIFIGI
jgi:hypothetical protein